MAGKSNPFTAKAKASKSKLKPFGAKKKGGVKKAPPKPAPRVSAKPPVVAKRDNPFVKRARRKSEIAEIEARIQQLMVDYDVAFDLESKTFAKLEKMKPGSALQRTTEKKWSAAMLSVERIQSRLLMQSLQLRKLKGKT